MATIKRIIPALLVVGIGGALLLGSGSGSDDAAREALDAGALVLDVRTPAEFAQGHVPNALNIPFDQLAARVEELPAKDRPIVLYCRSGRRSAIAARTLRDRGFSNLVDVGPMSALSFVKRVPCKLAHDKGVCELPKREPTQAL